MTLGIRVVALVVTFTFSGCFAFAPYTASDTQGRYGTIGQATMPRVGEGLSQGFDDLIGAVKVITVILLVGGAVVGIYFLGRTISENRKDESELQVHKPACAAGDARACFESGDRSKEMSAAACRQGLVAACKQACADGIASACFELGDQKIQTMDSACQEGNAKACYQLGRKYLHGTGVELDKAKARKYFGKACEDNYENACVLESR